MIICDTHLELLNASVRRIRARVELYNGSTLLNTFKCSDRLINFTIERVGESKFFGFGVCQKLNVKLLDVDRELDITTANSLMIAFGAGCHFEYFSPIFYVTEVHRDENTNELSITAYDALYIANIHKAEEITIKSYSIRGLAEACASIIGIPLYVADELDAAFSTFYSGGANIEGRESIRDILDDIAEATQTIYFIDRDWRLTFRRLDKDGAPVFTIDKSKYFTLDSKTNRRLATIAHVTELGDNVAASTEASGSTQYVRDNCLWDLREDIGELVDAAILALGGLTINQFECSWRGNYLLEIGDKIALTTKDENEVYSYILDDVIFYDGTLSQESQWSYEDNEEESELNPSFLGDVLKQTYARVDKAAQKIDLVVNDVAINSEAIATLQLNTEGINASMQTIERDTNEALGAVNESIEVLTNRVDATLTSEEIRFEIQSELTENGISKITTNTGFTFDDEGLTVNKSGSEMKTQITEDGMTVYKNDEAMLVANNVGVNAVNLHANTYLIIGNNSRFEDYGDARTGCFWIGG